MSGLDMTFASTPWCSAAEELRADARSAVRSLTYKGDALLLQALIFLSPDLVVQAVRVIREMDHDGSLIKAAEATPSDGSAT